METTESHNLAANDRMAWYGPPGEGYFAPPAPPGVLSMGTLWRGRWLVLLSLLVALGVAHWKSRQDPAVFESTAQLLVTKLTRSGTQVNESVEDLRPEMENQIVVLRSPRIVDRAIARGKLASLPSLAGSADVAGAVRAGLKIRQQVGTRGVLELRFAGTASRDSQTILQSLIDVYHETLREKRLEFNEETAQLITRAKDELLGDLNRREAEYLQFRREAPPIWNADDKGTIHRSRLNEIEAARSDLIIVRSQMQAELRMLEQALREGVDKEAIAMMVAKLATRSGADDATRNARADRLDEARELLPLLVQERELLETLGDEHPRVREVRNRIELTRKLVRETNASVLAEQSKPQRDMVTTYLESLRQEIRVTEAKESQLDALYRTEQDATRNSLDVELRDEQFRSDIARMKALFDAVVQRLGEMNMSKELGGFSVDVISPPTPGIQVAPVPWFYLAIGGACGALVGLLLATFKELTRRAAAAAKSEARETAQPPAPAAAS
jgi:hypothetical protein